MNRGPLTQEICESQGKDYNPTTKKCVSKCKSGKIRDASFKCVNPDLTQEMCDSQGKDYNPTTKKCVPKCKSGKIRDASFKCVNPDLTQEICDSQGKDYRPSTKKCVPKCKSGETRDVAFKCRPRMTQITDDNIEEYVNLYIVNKRYLPNDLKNISINDWDVSNVTNMNNLFKSYGHFNEPLNRWNVSNVTNMERMFFNCSLFNQPLNQWNVSNVTNMKEMFYGCPNFDQPLHQWNVSNVTNMEQMFCSCSLFNQPLNQWNVSNVTNMKEIFSFCNMFNQPLNDWNVSNVTNMVKMFFSCKRFNQPLNQWNVSNVTNMAMMFFGCKDFNQPLNTWVIRDEVDVASLFLQTTSMEPQNYPPPKLHPVIEATPIPTTEQSIIIPSDATAYDILDIREITLTSEFLTEYFKDTNNILFLQNNKFYFSTRSDLKDAVDVNNKNNSIVFICNKVENKLFITRDLLRNETPYLNLLGLGMYGYAPVSEIQYIITDPNNNKLYVMTDTNDNAPTVVSWAIYKLPGENIVGRSHCQDGRNGQIFNLSIGKLAVNYGGSSFRRRKTSRLRRNTRRKPTRKKRNTRLK